MKPDIATLRSLAALLERADDMHAELWAHIVCALLAPDGSKVQRSRLNNRKWHVYQPPTRGQEPLWRWEPPTKIGLFADVEAWNDAAAELHGMLLPGWVTNIISYGEPGKFCWHSEIRCPQDDTPIGESAPTESLARLRAIVAALIAQAEGRDGAE